MSEFEIERRRWSEEVDAEAARLLREGVPPYEAIDRARTIIAGRRKRKSSQPITDECPYDLSRGAKGFRR